MKVIGWIMTIFGSLLVCFFTVVSFYYIITTITEAYYGTIGYNEMIKNFYIICISIILDIISYVFFCFVGMILIED